MTTGYVAGSFVHPNVEFSYLHASSDAHPTRSFFVIINPFEKITVNQGFSTGAIGPLWGPRSGSPGATSRGLY